jgi:hypothetical protein
VARKHAWIAARRAMFNAGAWAMLVRTLDARSNGLRDDDWPAGDEASEEASESIAPARGLGAGAARVWSSLLQVPRRLNRWFRRTASRTPILWRLVQ